MKKLISVFSLLVVAVLLLGISPRQAAEASSVNIELMNPPKNGLLELAVGESYTFDVEITSDEPFLIALAMSDAYYPGRGVTWAGPDRAVRATDAMLHLSVTGKASTADLFAVCDWPEPGSCWPEGVAPVSIAAGVRYVGGVAVAEIFAFAIVVP